MLAAVEGLKFRLDKNIPVPLYYQLKQFIINEIEAKRLKEGDCLPAEVQLMEELGISRQTVRQAMGELVGEGRLYRLKGKGTFVSRPKIDEQFFQRLDSFNSEMAAKGMKPSTKVLDFKVVPSIPKINELLGLQAGESLIYLYRLRFADGEPIVALETYLSSKDCPGLPEEDLAARSLYEVLEERYNRKAVRAVRNIEVMNAGKEDSKLLHIRKNDAIFLVKTTAYDRRGLPLEYSVARYRGDRNRFSIELVNK